MEIEDYFGAIDDWTRLIEWQPANREHYRWRGECYAAIHSPAQALADFSRVLRDDPRRAALWVRRGEMNARLGRLECAAADFDRAAQLGLNSKDVYFGGARVYEAHGQFDAAIEQCRKAQRLVPDSPDIFGLEGQIYARQKHYTRAIDQLTRAIELTDALRRKAEYLYERGIAHYEQQEYYLAVDDLQLAAGWRPHHAGTRIWRAAASARLEDWPAVIEALQEAIAPPPRGHAAVPGAGDADRRPRGRVLHPADSAPGRGSAALPQPGFGVSVSRLVGSGGGRLHAVVGAGGEARDADPPRASRGGAAAASRRDRRLHRRDRSGRCAFDERARCTL